MYKVSCGFKKGVKICAVVIFVAIPLILMFKTSILGYSVYAKATDVDKIDCCQDASALKPQLYLLNASLASCNDSKVAIMTESRLLSEKLVECTRSLGAYETNLTMSSLKYENEIGSLFLELKKGQLDMMSAEEASKELDLKRKSELVELQRQYDLLALNSANNLCCKQKVDNPDISYYDVEKNRILCRESGSWKLSCG